MVLIISDSESGSESESDSEMDSESEDFGSSSNLYSTDDMVVGRDVASESDMDCSSSEEDSDGDDSEYDPSEIRFHAEEAIYVLQCRMVAWLVAQGIPDVELPRVTGAFLLARAKILASEWDSMENSDEYDSCLNGNADQVLAVSKMSEIPRNLKAKRGFPEDGSEAGETRGAPRRKVGGGKV